MNPVLLVFLIGCGCLHFKQALADECMPTFVDCYCENNFEQYVQIAVNTALKTDEETGITSCTSEEYPPDICAKKNCTIVPNENFLPLFGKGRKINIDDLDEDKNLLSYGKGKKYRSNYTGVVFRKRRFSDKLFKVIASERYPMEIVIPAGGDRRKKVKRSFRENCELPHFENSEVTCWKWPSWMTCDVQCIYGYGIESKKGTIVKTSMNCRKTEDKWKPEPVQDCKPYLNCKTHLKTPGELNCKQLTKEPSYCEIKCEDYDDEPATNLKKYICDEDFSPPHCAVLDKSIKLIPAPFV